MLVTEQRGNNRDSRPPSGFLKMCANLSREGADSDLKTDSLMDSLRKEPRFQAIERELKFPD